MAVRGICSRGGFCFCGWNGGCEGVWVGLGGVVFVFVRCVLCVLDGVYVNTYMRIGIPRVSQDLSLALLSMTLVNATLHIDSS